VQQPFPSTHAARLASLGLLPQHLGISPARRSHRPSLRAGGTEATARWRTAAAALINRLRLRWVSSSSSSLSFTPASLSSLFLRWVRPGGGGAAVGSVARRIRSACRRRASSSPVELREGKFQPLPCGSSFFSPHVINSPAPPCRLFLPRPHQPRL
jgi:hypothetical protein